MLLVTGFVHVFILYYNREECLTLIKNEPVKYLRLCLFIYVRYNSVKRTSINIFVFGEVRAALDHVQAYFDVNSRNLARVKWTLLVERIVPLLWKRHILVGCLMNV